MKTEPSGLIFDRDYKQDASVALTKLKSIYFRPEMELTLIARLPGNDECYIIISNDKPLELAELLTRYARKDNK